MLPRRTLLQSAAAALLPAAAPAQSLTGRKKSVIVIGAGLAGLSCAYELMRRGHDAIVLEASGRTGGHVKTLRDPFADGLYADIGAEHFYYPGYKEYWRYIQEFHLIPIAYPRRDNMIRYFDGKPYSEEDLHSRKVLAGFGFSQREIDFLANRSWGEFQLLYTQRYVDQIQDEANPFVPALAPLDTMTVAELLKREGASPSALRFFGGSGNALQSVWAVAVKKLRGTDLESKKLFRLQGGNQLMTDAFATRLGNRVHLGSPVTRIEHGPSGVTITARESGAEKKFTADYSVSCINAVVLRQIPVSPAWPESKSFVIQNMPYYTRTRVVFQTRTRFWETDHVSPNWTPPNPQLNELWSMANEVPTPRGILLGGSQPGVPASASLAAFHKMYPGKSADIEQTYIYDWAKDPWAGMCERTPYRPGELAKYWPETTRPVGRIHFAGAYADLMTWGQEAALESGNRAAREIDRA